MKERPILFSGPMVCAIRDGAKTQTRRIINPRPGACAADGWNHSPPPPKRHKRPYIDAYNGGPGWCWWDEWDRCCATVGTCPYGVPGGRLWVRESFQVWHGPDIHLRYRADGAVAFQDDRRLLGVHSRYMPGKPAPWRPSIFMPRWTSRITLEVESVRVELLRSISVADAIAEGVEHVNKDPLDDPVGYFAVKWDQINGKKPGGFWLANPWVWVVTFRRVDS